MRMMIKIMMLMMMMMVRRRTMRIMMMSITMRTAKMRMRLTIVMTITTRMERMTPKYSAKTRGMIMTVMLRQQQKTLKTCWTERSRAKEAISLVTPSYTHSHFVLDENMEEKNNPGKYSEEYEQQTREDLWRFAKTMIGLSLWFIFLLSNREQEARQRREEMLMQKQDAKQMQVDHNDDWMTIVIAMAR